MLIGLSPSVVVESGSVAAPFAWGGWAGYDSGGVTTAHPWTLPMPAGYQAQDMGIIIANKRANFAFTVPSGWTNLQSAYGTNNYHSIFYRILDGTEPSTVTMATGDTTATRYATMVCLLIKGVHPTSAPQITARSSNTTDKHNPPSITPSGWTTGQDKMFIPVVMYEDGTASVIDYPTSFTNGGNRTNASTAASGIGFASKIDTAASIDPTVFTLTTSEIGHAVTIAVRSPG